MPMRKPCAGALGAIGVSAKRWQTRVDLNELLVTAKSLIESESTSSSLQEIAIKAGLSEFHFQRLFVERFGISPTKLVSKQRLSMASDLLANSETPIWKVAISCGFDNPSAFSRFFARNYGCSPSSYRRQAISARSS